jgi:hypothetical protein
MPAAIPALAVAIASAAKLSSLTVAFIGLAASMGASLLQSSMSKKSSYDPETSAAVTAQGIKANTRSTNEPLPVVYGKMKIGGNIVFMEAVGTSNDDLWIVQNLAEGECDSVYQDGGVDQIWHGEALYNTFGGNITYTFHDGASDQTYDTDLHTAISKWTDNKHNTTYIAYKLVYDEDYFQGVQDFTLTLKGRKLYDFRDASTAWSQNGVLALYDYMTNKRYGDGYDTSRFDTTSWEAAANYWDSKGWELNMFIKTQSSKEVRDSICQLFRGQLVWYDGKWYLRYYDLDVESSCKTITDAHILQDGSGKAAIKISEGSKFNVPDGIQVTFIDETKDYVDDTIQIGESTGYVETVRLDGCTDRQHATDIGTYLLERMQLNRGITLSGRGDLIEVEPSDVITLTSESLGVDSQLMRVADSTIAENGEVALSLQYESTDLYDSFYNINTEEIYTCSLPDPHDEPPAVGGASISEEQYYYRLRNFTKLKVDFTVPSNFPWFDHVDVYLSYDDVTYEYLYPVKESFEILNVKEGITYYIKLKVVGLYSKQQYDNDTKLSHYVLGYTTEPDSLSALSAIANANSVNVYASKLDDEDIEVYEFRTGSSWSAAIFMAALRAPNLSLIGVKPGTHTFWCNTLSNNGSYGDSAVDATITLQDPPDGWAVIDTQTCDYDGIGTHDNTEPYDYGGEDYLKCSHTADVLVGTYTSPIYDYGSSERVLAYVLADIVVIGAGTTWNDIMPDPDTWEDAGLDTLTWAKAFELTEGPTVRMTLNYGETSPPTSSVSKMEILSAIVTGRYFQVEIEITDPNLNINCIVENFSLKLCQ